MTLNHRERLENTISGAKVDRPAVSLWRHFPVDDQYPELLASSTLRFQNTFDFDFVKISPSSSFCTNDWGTADVWEGNPEGSRRYTVHPVKSVDEWSKLKKLSPRAGCLAKQLTCVDLVRKNLQPTTPVIQTIFSPLSQAKNLVGKYDLIAQLRLHPQEIKDALQVITDTTIDFLEEATKLGIDGIFFAEQFAQYSLLTRAEFVEFGLAFDCQILAAAKALWFNFGHIHGENIMFDVMDQLPLKVLNWHDRETFPTLAVGKTMTAKALCGGLRQWETLAYGTPESVSAEALDALQQTQGNRFILGTGCVTPVIAPDSNIYAAREAVERFAGLK
ncbi:MAG: uroporphyrinogen decarboxylase family protein [Anaerolineaceae bacterium]|nr:uroporphyrinogen decarboxylase family protein [Anaerolineaceae bacterium]